MKAGVGDDMKNKVREAHRRIAMGDRNSTAQPIQSTAQRFQLFGTMLFALAVLSGCGQDGSQGPAGAAGSAPVTNATGLSADQQKALSITGTVTSVTIASKPVVNFTLKDASGKGITGLGYTTTTVRGTTYAVPTYTNIQFALAKLVPADATTGAPSKWVSYIVTSVPTAAAPTVVGLQRPSTDATGSLADHGDGTYTYTFYRDIAQVASVVAGYTDTSTNKKADVGDVTYEPNRIHRLVIQVGGEVRGTGGNTADGVQVTPAVQMSNPVDIVYDFIPATGATVSATDANGREIVKVNKCFECHTKFTFHGGDALKNWPGTRQDTRYCVVCHTDQRKFGRTNSTPSAFPGAAFTGNVYRVNDMAVGNFPVYIHKIHMGEDLTIANSNFTGLVFNEITFPQDARNCVKCHDGTSGASNATAQGDNWKNNPNRLVCTACHDNVNFSTGGIIDTATGTETPHPGGGADWSTLAAPDSTCAGCHADPARTGDKAYVPLAHTPVAPPDLNNKLFNTATGNANTNAAWIAAFANNLPTGAATIAYKLQSVSLDASNHPVVIFKLTKNGSDVVFNTFGSAAEMMGPPADTSGDTFIGAPSLQFAYAAPEDGITTPSDFNANPSVYLKNVWNGSAGTLTGPDGSGYYTATATGITIPAGAVMLTGGIGFGYNVTSSLPLTQTNLTAYPSPDPNQGSTANTGGLIVQVPVAWMTATGYTARRLIVEKARCNNCHAQLGVSPTFHAGQRNDSQVCAFCHNVNQTSAGWAGRSANFIHAIHAADKRSNNFTWHSTSLTHGYWDVTFPGVLRNCQACHLAGTYDYSASAYTDTLIGNLPFSTVASGTSALNPSATTALSPYVVAGTIYGQGFTVSAAGATTYAAATTLVSSPIATACFACHDSSSAKAHMTQNGASLYATRSSLGSTGANEKLTNNEQCLVCHGPGKEFAIADMHAKQ
jgi:OmcA/MtrC family decaheme c-type cytochrome